MEFINKITSGNKKILDSGIFTLADDENSCEFLITDSQKDAKLIISFHNTNDKKESIKREINGNILELKCFNFNISGTGLKGVPNIATITRKNNGEDKEYDLYFNFWASKKTEDANWCIEYTFYIDE